VNSSLTINEVIFLAEVIDGAGIAASLLEQTKNEVDALKQRGISPTLAVILVGNNPASELYIEKKKLACEALGITFDLFRFKETVSEKELLELIKALNYKVGMHGILVQLPLPPKIDKHRILDSISPLKDVDGFTSFNLGLLAYGNEELASCTAKGIIKLIESTGLDPKGKNVCIVNHSIVVGRPLSQMILNRNATVTVCHQFTQDLASFTSKADILVTAVGKPGLITADMVKQAAIVIDAGIAKADGKTVGDVDFGEVSQKASFISPVPGGVGPLTVACLLQNVAKLASMQRK